MWTLDKPLTVRTKFREFHGTYETPKAEALTKHLRDVANYTGMAQKVSLERLAELQEWETVGGNRAGQWVTELTMEQKP